MTKRRKIISIAPKPFQWLVGHPEKNLVREPFSSKLRTITVQCIPNDAQGSLSEGGDSAIVTLSCSHIVEWERPFNVYSSLEEWVHSLQNRIGRYVCCRQCADRRDGVTITV